MGLIEKLRLRTTVVRGAIHGPNLRAESSPESHGCGSPNITTQDMDHSPPPQNHPSSPIAVLPHFLPEQPLIWFQPSQVSFDCSRTLDKAWNLTLQCLVSFVQCHVYEILWYNECIALGTVLGHIHLMPVAVIIIIINIISSSEDLLLFWLSLLFKNNGNEYGDQTAWENTLFCWLTVFLLEGPTTSGKPWGIRQETANLTDAPWLSHGHWSPELHDWPQQFIMIS